MLIGRTEVSSANITEGPGKRVRLFHDFFEHPDLFHDFPRGRVSKLSSSNNWGMEPRSGFQLRGEQIDGSFVLDGDTYLLEAHWRNAQTNQADLLTFSGKVAGKSEWSRGLFVSYSGFTDEGLDALSRNRPTNIVCVDGLALHFALDAPLSLPELVRKKARRAAETGSLLVSARALFPTLI